MLPFTNLGPGPNPIKDRQVSHLFDRVRVNGMPSAFRLDFRVGLVQFNLLLRTGF